MFRRTGRKVYAAHWGYDGSLKVFKGNQKLSRGNTFVVAAVVVMLPFLGRPVALPVLTRLWRKGGPAKTVLARELVEVIATHSRGRTVHVVADGAYLCTELRRLPPHVTLTGPLRSNASLWHTHPDLDHPPRLRGRGDPGPTPRGSAPPRTWRHDTFHLCHGHPLRTHHHYPGSPGAVPVARRVRRPPGPCPGARRTP